MTLRQLADSTRDHTIAERSKNYRYSTNHQVVIDADTRLLVVVGRPLAGNAARPNSRTGKKNKGESVSAIAKALGVSRATLYRHIGQPLTLPAPLCALGSLAGAQSRFKAC